MYLLIYQKKPCNFSTWLHGYLKRLGPESGAWLQGAPPRGPAVQTVHAHLLGRETDGTDVGGEVHPSVESHHRHVEAVSLRGELEIGVDLDG